MGAHEVSMLRGLLEANIVPDLIVGTSIGAVNGAIIASGPSLATVDRLAELWTSLGRAAAFEGSVGERLTTIFRKRTHIFDNSALRRLIADALPVESIEDQAGVPDGVAVHVLPTGDPKRFNDLRQYGGAKGDSVTQRIEQSYAATAGYLAEHRLGRSKS